MAIDKDLAAWQVLGVAIRSEIDAAAFYTGLQARIKNILLIQKLKFLALEEEHHRKILERLLGQKYPDKPKDVPASSQMPPIAADLPAEPSVPELFEAAAGRIEDEAGRRILGYLGRVERSHQAIIKSEIDLIAKFPDYYNVEDFHLGQDLFHVGP